MQHFVFTAYKTTYGTDPVWKRYRRNFKGAFAPRKTRKTCIVSPEFKTILGYHVLLQNKSAKKGEILILVWHYF